MKQFYRFLLVMGVALATTVCTHAQRVSFVEPKEDATISVAPNQSKVVIRSNSERMEMAHNMGLETGVRSTQNDGTFLYTIVYEFPEEYEEDFMKSTFLVRLPGGQKEFLLVLRKGKGFSGSFDENLSLMAERNNDGVYPESKAAKVTFMSDIEKLSIECNGKPCFVDGKVVQSEGGNMMFAINDESDVMKSYSIVFLLDEEKKTPLFIKHPVFKIKSHFSDEVEVDLGGDLENKKSYSYTVTSNVKVVEREVSFEEILDRARAKEKENDFFAAATAYQDARSHSDCPADRRGELEEKLGKMNSARKFLHYAEKFEGLAARTERKEGFTADSVFIYYRGAIRSYRKVLEYAPDAVIYGQRAETLDNKLKGHPMNNKEVTVVVKYQEITGKHPNGGGIPIYASYSSDKLKGTKDRQPLGTTRGDGSFRLVFKNTPPPYIYFYGDKKSYAIDSTTTEIKF